MTQGKCRFCGTPLEHTFVDLGVSPESNAYVSKDKLQQMEPFYPLHAFVCEKCFLVQLEEFQTPQDIFSDYAYFSSYSQSWLDHSKRYVEMMIPRFELNDESLVVEIASNDGYLLQYFAENKVPVLGVEPAANVAEYAIKKGIPTEVAFFGVETAKRLFDKKGPASLILGNNVLAHVPDINDFVEGMHILLADDGIITMEFPHLMRLIEYNQFDTIYHEHFSYLALVSVEKIFEAHGLKLFDVEELPTHGGSLRIFAQQSTGTRPVSDRLLALRKEEAEFGLDKIETYLDFSKKVEAVKVSLLEFLIKAKKEGKKVAGYGAPAKGNTLLNYCGVGKEFIKFTVDRSPHKQDLYLPGTHIPIYAPDKIIAEKPDYLIILPWNLKNEIMEQMAQIREWGGKFVTPIPEVEVHE
jgi:SAM-dependent methyltransferase